MTERELTQEVMAAIAGVRGPWGDDEEFWASNAVLLAVRPATNRIEALQDALRSVLVAYSDIPLPIELRGRLRAILEDSAK